MSKKVCDICGSDRYVQKYNKFNLHLCSKHAYHYIKYGKPLTRTFYDSNEITEYGAYAEIALYNKQSEEVARAIIDLDDIERCKRYKWLYDSSIGYVKSSNRQHKIYLHRFILNAKKGEIVDHINHNPLDNRKSNLRKCNKAQNAHNYNTKIKEIRGVYYIKDRNKWIASIQYKGKKINLGTFDTQEEAILARLKAEKLYCKDFAPLRNEVVHNE